MSSTAAVATGVTYHFPKQIDARKQKSNLKDNVPLECNGSLKNGGSFGSHNSAVSNIDAALRTSFKPFTNLSMSGNNMNTSLNIPEQSSLIFHESTVPSLDTVVKKKIETFPNALILSDSEYKDVSSAGALCTDTELLNWCHTGNEYVPRRSVGLTNSGNTCYLNSVLQCLLASGPLLAYISSRHSRQSSCNFASQNGIVGGGIKSRFCALCGLYRLLIQHPQGEQVNGFGSLTPSYFVTNVKAICPIMRLYQQEDAHEFLLGLLSRMEDCLTAGFKKIPRNLSENNVIRRIFGGLIRSEVTCNFCLKVSIRDDPCFNLSLDITCSRSLQQCLYNYIRSEQLCGSNAYKCENCRQLRPAVRRSTLFQPPPILIIQFNRFYRCQKLDTRVEYPSSFNIRPFMSETCGAPVLYRLFATVNHEGHSCRSGHYVAFTRRHSVWLLHNDNSVTSTSPESVLRQTPYLLFYEAVDPDLAAVPTETKSPSVGSDDTSCFAHKPLSVGDIPLPSCHPPRGATGRPEMATASAVGSTKPETGLLSPFASPASSGSSVATAPRIIFNPSVVGPQRFSLASSSQSSLSDSVSLLLKPSSTLASSVNGKTGGSLDKMKSQPVPLTSQTNRGIPGTGISSLTVRQLLYGEHNMPDLWTEKSLAITTGGVSKEAASLSSTTSLNHQSTKPSNGSVAVPAVNGGRRAQSESDSDSSESIVWMPVTRKELTDSATAGGPFHGKKQRDRSLGSSASSSKKKSKRWREKMRRRREKRERDAKRGKHEGGHHRHHHHRCDDERLESGRHSKHRNAAATPERSCDRRGDYYHHYQPRQHNHSNRHSLHERHRQHHY